VTWPRMREYEVFTPSPGGELTVLLEEKSEDGYSDYLVRFDSDGGFGSASPVQGHFRGSYLGSFPSGDLLIGGVELPPDPKTIPAGVPLSPNRAPFVGIFDSRGQLLRRVVLPNDAKAKDEAGEGPAGQPYIKADAAYQAAMVFSFVNTGQDGDVYLTRDTNGGPVYSISPSGAALDVIDLTPPRGGTLRDVKVAGRRLMAVYSIAKANTDETAAVVVRELDLYNGQQLGDYHHSDFHIGGLLACASPPYYTFLGSNEKGKLTLVRTTPQ